VLVVLSRYLGLILLVLVAWQLVATVVDNPVLPDVPAFIVEAAATVTTPLFWSSVGSTLIGWGIGLGLAVLVGVPFGLLIGYLPILDHATRVTIDVCRSLPLIAVVPLLVLNFGTTMTTKVILVFLAAVWPLIIHAGYGAREVDLIAKETASSYGLTRWQRIRFLYYPSSLGIIATGLRISAIIALGVCIGVELITSTAGLGLEILRSGANGDPSVAFVYFIAASFVGLIITMVFERIERRALFWSPKFR
jgi:ABC-type nitrate/sulfonate/bicarbonate transport system permease component